MRRHENADGAGSLRAASAHGLRSHGPRTALALTTAILGLAASAVSAQSSISTSGDIETAGKLVSTATSGPPLVVATANRVINLNADLLDGFHSSLFARQLDLDDLGDLTAALQSTIDEQEQLIARLHPSLTLFNGRFRVWVTFEDDGVAQPARPMALSDEQGYFFFTRHFYTDV